MDFYTTLPPHVYSKVDHGYHHLVQAPHLAAASPAHQDWFSKLQSSDSNPVTMIHSVILDNGAWELGKGDGEVLLAMADAIHPNEIVVPDSFQDSRATIRLLDEWMEECAERSDVIMIVPQGRDLLEWCLCLSEMQAILRAGRLWTHTVVGIPKVLESYPGGRYGALSWMAYRGIIPVNGVHLLGVWSYFQELENLATTFPFVRSADTTFPYAWAMEGEMLSESLAYRTDMAEEWWTKNPMPAQLQTAELNIAICRYRICSVDRRPWYGF